MVFPVIMTEHVLVFIVSRSQDHQLHIVGTDLVHHALDQIQALLIRKTGNDADHEFLVISCQSQFLLERQLILCLFLPEIFRVILLGDIGIGLRVEIIVIDAVDDPPQVVGPGSHESVQALAVKRGLDLLCVGAAHGGDGVRIYQAAL